jgi:hypothetical protein
MPLPRGPYFSDHNDEEDSVNRCRPRVGVRYQGSRL